LKVLDILSSFIIKDYFNRFFSKKSIFRYNDFKVSIFKIRPILILSLITFFLLANRLSHNLVKPVLNVSSEEKIYNVNEKIISVFNLGFSSAIASLLWVHTLLESDEEIYKKRDLGSWMFIRFNTIAALDKRFYDNYLFGGKYLSIIKDDIIGAEELFHKGLKEYPQDFWLSINTAHNYLFEMGNTAKALKHYSNVKFDPLAKKYFPLLPSLVAKLERERGSPETAFELLKVAHEKASTPRFKTYYAEKLYALKAEMDLKCLNNIERIDCSRLDFFGNSYLIDKSGIYFSKYGWKKFKFSRKTKKRISNKRGN